MNPDKAAFDPSTEAQCPACVWAKGQEGIKALEAERDQLRELLGEMVKCLGPIHMRLGTWFGGIEGANWRGDLLVRAKAAQNPPAEARKENETLG